MTTDDRAFRAWLDEHVADFSAFDRPALVAGLSVAAKAVADYERALAELDAAAGRSRDVLERAMNTERGADVGERITQVRAWLTANIDEHRDAGALQLAVVDHFNTIKDFWRAYAIECLNEMISSTIEQMYREGRRRGHALADDEPTPVPQSSARRLVAELTKATRRTSVAEVIAQLERKRKDWSTHREYVGGRRRVVIFEMTADDCLAAADFRLRQAAPDLAYAYMLRAIAGKLAAGEKVGEKYDDGALNDLYLAMVGGDWEQMTKEAAD